MANLQHNWHIGKHIWRIKIVLAVIWVVLAGYLVFRIAGSHKLLGYGFSWNIQFSQEFSNIWMTLLSSTILSFFLILCIRGLMESMDREWQKGEYYYKQIYWKKSQIEGSDWWAAIIPVFLYYGLIGWSPFELSFKSFDILGFTTWVVWGYNTVLLSSTCIILMGESKWDDFLKQQEDARQQELVRKGIFDPSQERQEQEKKNSPFDVPPQD